MTIETETNHATETLRALLEWLRPRQNLRWLVLGSVPPDALQFLGEQTAASEIVWANGNGAHADHPKIRAGDLNALVAAAQQHDATVVWNALENEKDAATLVAQLTRVTRLYGTLAAVSQGLDKRALWNIWLDARLNDVSTRALADESGWMVRGTR